VRELFEHVGASQGFYHALGRARILDRQFQVGVDRLSVTIGRRLAARGQNGGPVPPEVAARALAGALCALLRWWVDTRSSISAARMDQLYHSLHFAPHA
jgi:hypothetical protein